MCDEVVTTHRILRATRNHELVRISPSPPNPNPVPKLPACELHIKSFGIYDRTCERLICADVCQYLDEHKACELVALMREKEERVDKDAQLKSLCEQMDVDATLKQLEKHQATANQLLKDIEQDKAFTLGRLAANHTLVLFISLPFMKFIVVACSLTYDDILK
jgi:hypothetical protein